MVINAAKQSCTIVKEYLIRKLVDTTRNTINFLNTLFEEELTKLGINDRFVVITLAIKVVEKHQHIETIQAKIVIMLHQVNTFKGSFISLFQKGFASF